MKLLDILKEIKQDNTFNPGGACTCPTLEWFKEVTSNIGREEGDEIKPKNKHG